MQSHLTGVSDEEHELTWALRANVSGSSAAAAFKILRPLREKEIRGYVMFDESGCFPLAYLFLRLITQTQ